MSEFLSDEKGLAEYRDAYRIFVGDRQHPASVQSFDSVWDVFISQLRLANDRVPGFANQVWQANPDWRKSEFKIEGESKGSGLVATREDLLDVVKRATDEAVKYSERLHSKSEAQRKVGIRRITEDLINRFGILPSDELQRLSRKERKAYDIRIGGDRKQKKPGLADDASAEFLAAYLTSVLLQKNEGLRDYILSGDPDMTREGIGRLARLESFAEFFEAEGLGAAKSVLPYLKHSSPRLEMVVRDYERGRQSMQEFRSVKDASPSESLRIRLQELNAEGVPEDKIRSHLSAELASDYDTWKKDAGEVNRRKSEVLQRYQSPFFSYKIFEDPVRKTLRLQADAPMALNYVASPRPFHLLLAGRRNLECVGGGDCNLLVAKRWARASLLGDRSLFSLQPDGTMEGFIGLTQVSRTGEKEPYWILDLGSRATKGEIIFKNQDGRPIKYSFFDALIDKLSAVPKGEAKPRFIISDGDTVSANVAGSELVQRSQAYNELKRIGTPSDFRPVDAMATKIATELPQTFHNYGRGGMIYDGMPSDGMNVYELVPMADRKHWTKDELEFELYLRGLAGSAVEERTWLRAFESAVRLESAQHYREKQNAYKFFRDWVKSFIKRNRAPEFGESWDVDFSRLHTLDSHPVKEIYHLVRNAEMIDLLAEKLLTSPDRDRTERILGLSLMAGDIITDKLIDATVAALSAPRSTVAAQRSAAHALSNMAKHAAQNPKVVADDVIETMVETVKRGGPDDGLLYADVFAASYFDEALKALPEESRLVSPSVLKALTERLTAATESPTLIKKSTSIIEGIVRLYARVLKVHPKPDALLSEETFKAMERYLAAVDTENLPLFGLPLFVFQALKADPSQAYLRTSPLIAIGPVDKFTQLLSANLSEPRLQHPRVWARLTDLVSGHGQSEGLKLVAQIIAEAPQSGALSYRRLIQKLTGIWEPEASPIRQFLIERNKENPAFAEGHYLSQVFERDLRDEMRQLLTFTYSDALTQQLKRTVGSKLGLLGYPDPEFFEWLFGLRNWRLRAEAIAQPLLEGFSQRNLTADLMESERLTTEQKVVKWFQGPGFDNAGVRYVEKFYAETLPKGERFLMAIFGPAIAKANSNGERNSDVVGLRVVEELLKLSRGSYLARMITNVVLQNSEGHVFSHATGLYEHMVQHAGHPFIPTYLDDIEAAIKKQIHNPPALDHFGDILAAFAARSSGVNRKKTLEKVQMLKGILETQGPEKFRCFSKLQRLKADVSGNGEVP